jgi:PTH1 family peptidyl-tRNA hydrolase
LQETACTLSEMLVVVDDFNLPLGSLRFRRRGSDGGHKGLLSLIEVLGTDEFARLRLGIGPLTDGVEAADFVLSPFEPEQQEAARRMIDTAGEAVVFAIDHRLESAMSKYNSSPALSADDPDR